MWCHLTYSNDLNFVKIDGKFKPEELYIELADGSQENNIALKRGTVRMIITDSLGVSCDSLLENALYTIISSKYIFGAGCYRKRSVC